MTSAGEADCQVPTDTDDSARPLAQAGKAECHASVTIPSASECQATVMTSGVVAENGISEKPAHSVPQTVYSPTFPRSESIAIMQQMAKLGVMDV